eukprot:GILJ01012161.1.p1 GENE.GILJ01012161.1~~GILJ01012161.1.p1  ORF type:complete len:447 (+),score=33.31 GILJ01012161.1:472-1812(+)
MHISVVITAVRPVHLNACIALLCCALLAMEDKFPTLKGQSATIKDSFGALLKEEETRPIVLGVLAINVKEANKLQQAFGDETRRFNCYVRISNRSLSKRTSIGESSGFVRWSELKHFPVMIVRSRRHPFNMLKVQVIVFSHSNRFVHEELGSVYFNLHDVIKESPCHGTYDLFNQHLSVGDISLEFAFTYGLFGYGYSSQLKDEVVRVEQSLRFSLLPRLQPDADRLEQKRKTMLPNHSYSSIVLPYDQYMEKKTDISKSNEFESLRTKLCRLEDMQETYKSLDSRLDRLSFLRNQILANNQEIDVRALREESEQRQLSKRYMQFLQPTTTYKDSSVVPLYAPVLEPQALMTKLKGTKRGSLAPSDEIEYFFNVKYSATKRSSGRSSIVAESSSLSPHNATMSVASDSGSPLLLPRSASEERGPSSTSSGNLSQHSNNRTEPPTEH